MRKCAAHDKDGKPCQGHHSTLALVQGRWLCHEHAAKVLEAAKTRWAVRCPVHGLVYLTREQYDAQMNDADALWRCPVVHDAEVCGQDAAWDDDTYEAAGSGDE